MIMAAAADSWWWCMRIDGGGRDNVWRVVVSFLCDELTQRQKETIMATSFKVGSWFYNKDFYFGESILCVARVEKDIIHLGIYILHRSSFTYVGIDIPSVEVLKKNKLFVDRCQKHQVQNWSWPKISRVRNWYVIRNGLAVYNFAIMKRSSTRWNWYPSVEVLKTFENLCRRNTRSQAWRCTN